MPIINGLKMACEPCIRGHRSTKCTHAKERLMVPVRKPGRPLSVCPHPPGKSCSCGGITAAIPRVQKCGCGPPAAAANRSAQAPTAAENPALKGATSPTRRSFQVQKPANKVSARKQSFDLVNLERMDPESYSVHSAPPQRPSGTPVMASISNGGGDGPLSPVSSQPPAPDYLASLPDTLAQSAAVGFEGAAEHAVPPRSGPRLDLASPVIKAETPRSVVDGLANGTSYFDGYQTNPGLAEHREALAGNGVGSSKPTTPTAQSRSCCSGNGSGTKVNGNGNAKSPATTSVSQPLGQYMSSATPNSVGLANGTASLNQHIVAAGAPMMGAFQPAVVQPIFFAHSADPTIYTYPPYYGTYQHPILPPQWRHAMPSAAGMAYAYPPGQPLMGAQVHGISLGVGSEAGAAGFNSISHQCTCGDACNCLGCPAHPYNEVTQDYVRSAMNMLTEERQVGGAGGGGEQGGRGGGGGRGCCDGGGAEQVSAVSAEDTSSAGLQAPGSGQVADPASSPQAQTPSEASAASEDQTQLSASDFLFVTYPFGCEGETASCLCGDDCQCVGCLIHSHPYQDGT